MKNNIIWFIWNKKKNLIMYIFFGVLTTLINWVSYIILYNYMGINNILSNIIAWIFAVAFAYITNKLWVFESKTMDTQTIMDELWKFLSCRIITGLVDLVIMFIGVDLMKGPSTILKILSSIVVIILNYVASKLLVFVKK